MKLHFDITAGRWMESETPWFFSMLSHNEMISKLKYILNYERVPQDLRKHDSEKRGSGNSPLP